MLIVYGQETIGRLGTKENGVQEQLDILLSSLLRRECLLAWTNYTTN